MATIWELENFSAGLNTQPARTENGAVYAADMVNLTVDGDGFLHERVPLVDVGSALNTNPITGIASTPHYLFILRADGGLYLRETDGTVRQVPGTGGDLSGRISVWQPNRDIVILTSEGNDQGYWIDVRNLSALRAHTLGINPPTPRGMHYNFTATGSTQDANGLLISVTAQAGSVQTRYGYRFTFLRDAEGEPMDTMESNPAATVIVNITNASSPSVRFHAVDFPTDPQTTHMAVYRVEESDASSPFRTEQMRRVGTIPRGGDFTDDFSVAWEDGEQLDVYADRLPTRAKSFAAYENRICAPVGDRIVFSGFEVTEPKWWKFPPTQFVSHAEARQIDFCTSFREVLLFGGKDGLFRAEGADFELGTDLQSDRISHVGPVDGYSWDALEEVLAFIGAGNIYRTDAASVVAVTETALDGFFDKQTVERGEVLFAQNNTILFAVRFEGSTEDTILVRTEGRWERWEAGQWAQTDSLDGDDFIANSPVLQRIGWNADTPVGSDLAWAWESQLFYASKNAGFFNELMLRGLEEMEVTLRLYVDDADPVEIEHTVIDDIFVADSIPLFFVGNRLRFRIEGQGACRLRYLGLMGN